MCDGIEVMQMSWTIFRILMSLGQKIVVRSVKLILIVLMSQL